MSKIVVIGAGNRPQVSHFGRLKALCLFALWLFEPDMFHAVSCGRMLGSYPLVLLSQRPCLYP